MKFFLGLGAVLLQLLALPSLAAGGAENLAAAVRFPTVSNQDAELFDADAFLGMHAFLRETYPRVFAQLQVEVINTYSLLLIWPGQDSSRQPVLFTAHMDVVPVEPGTEDGWAHPPFAGVIAAGNIYGRGTLDDKVGVITLLEAAERLLEQGYRPARTLVFGFGHDEEIGGRQGAAMIAQRLREMALHFEWMVDEGGMILSDNALVPDRLSALIGVAEKGYLTLILKAHGEGGHSSMPPAHTAAGKLAAAVVRVENNPFAPRLVAPVEAMLEAAAPYSGFPNNLVLSNLWLTSSLVASQMAQERTTASFVRTTTAVTILRAGVKDNVIPQSAEAHINFRLLPGDTPELVIAHVREVIQDPEIEIETAPGWGVPPPVAAMTGGGFAAIEQAVLAVHADAVVYPYLLSGATDIRHYIDLADNHYRFHGAQIATVQASGIHGTDEYLAVASMEAAVDIAEQMLRAAN